MSTLAEVVQTGDLINYCLDESHEINFIPEQIETDSKSISAIAPGILIIEPNKDVSTDLLLSCGVHGNETAPIELVEQLFRQLIENTIPINCRLMIILGNLPAMRMNQRFCDENLNRLFKEGMGRLDNIESKRASEIMTHVDAFFEGDNRKIHLDLHTAIRGSKYEKFAIYPHQSDGNWNTSAMAWLTHADIEAILLANKPSGTFSCYTDNMHGAIGFTVELGKARKFGTNDHRRLQIFKDALVRLLETAETLFNNTETISGEVFNVADEVLKSTDSFKLNLSDTFENFTPLSDGYQLTNDGDNSYFINGDNKAVVFPNKNVPIGQRVALIVEPYQK